MLKRIQGRDNMEFQTIQYIDWFRDYWHDIEYDLATSGVHSIGQKELDIPVDDLNLGKTLFYGDMRLLEQISELHGVEKNEILITSGATHANYLICALLINEGDEVIVEHPVYTPLLDVVRLFKPKIKRLKRRFDEGYSVNVKQLNDMIGENTKMVVLTDLHNPSGALMDKDTLNALSEMADDTQTYFLVDEVYRDFMPEEGHKTFSLLTEYGITTRSLSKFYGTGALRIGWAMCDYELIERMRKINDYLLVTNSCASEALAALILKRRDWFVDKVKNITSRNYPIVESWIENRDDLECVLPKYGLIVFPRLKRDVDSMNLTELLLKKYRTLISPGKFFGAERHFRIGLGGDSEKLEKGLENIGLALDEFG